MEGGPTDHAWSIRGAEMNDEKKDSDERPLWFSINCGALILYPVALYHLIIEPGAFSVGAVYYWGVAVSFPVLSAVYILKRGGLHRFFLFGAAWSAIFAVAWPFSWLSVLIWGFGSLDLKLNKTEPL